MKYISYSIWGSPSSPYYQGLIENLKLIPECYPGWKPIVFHPPDLSDKLLLDIELYKSDVQLVQTTLPADWTGMFWRMLPILFSHSEYVCIRILIP